MKGPKKIKKGSLRWQRRHEKETHNMPDLTYRAGRNACKK